MLLNRIPARDVALAIGIIAVCLAVIIDARSLPPGLLENLGPAAVPQGIAFIVIGLVLLMLAIQLFKRPSVREGEVPAASQQPVRRRPLAAVVLFLVTIAYTAALQSRLISFAVASVAFVIAAGFVMTPATARSLLILGVLGIIMGFGLQYVFTQFFYVDLP